MGDPVAPTDPRPLSVAEPIVRRFWYAIDARDWAATRALLHDEFVAELPLSGERFVGPDAFLRMNREYPGGWALTVIRAVGAGERAASEVRSRRVGKTETVLSFYELKEGKLAWAADWWPEPYPAPVSRAALASPPAAVDPRLVWLDALDDARGDLLGVLEAMSPEDLRRPLLGSVRRPLDTIDTLCTEDEVAVANVGALVAGEPPAGRARDLAAHHAATVERAMARFYRARAELRLALWQAPVEAWTREPTATAGNEPIDLPAIVRASSQRERRLAEELRRATSAAPS